MLKAQRPITRAAFCSKKRAFLICLFHYLGDVEFLRSDWYSTCCYFSVVVPRSEKNGRGIPFSDFVVFL